VRELDPGLIRERCTYPAPTLPAEPAQRPSKYEWKFSDRFGNKYGRLTYRPAAGLETAGGQPWTDVFGRDVHLSEYRVGIDFAVATVAEDETFAIQRIVPPRPPVELFRTHEKTEIHGLSADGQFILVQSGDWLLPELMVLDLEGRVRARMDAFAGVKGCWAGEWSPVIGDQRIVFRHERTGYFQPAIWWPFEQRAEDVPVELEGEVHPIWDKTGTALILRRDWNGRSDLHRLNLETREREQLQPLDGVVFSYRLDPENRVEGFWAVNDRYAGTFRERERFPNALFKPSVPLTPWKFRRIAGVPCFVVGEQKSGSRWTIFDGYGMAGYHHTDGYNTKIHTLADHGFQVVMVNTRGCGGFGREWREAKRGRVGFTELEDLRRVRAALVEEGWVDHDRTIITGDSWGGLMTLLAMGTQPELWRMGAAVAPVADYEQAHWAASPMIRGVNRCEFGGNPRTHSDAYRKVSPLTYVDRIRAPVLIVAGRDDLLCPPWQNISFAETLRARGGECELYLYEGGHGAPDREERIRQHTRMIEFLLAHCRAFDAKAGTLRTI
jgi:dienelactone hydrolase